MYARAINSPLAAELAIKSHSGWTVWPNLGILYFNNELLNYQYLFGKQSIIEKLHDMTNKLQMTSMAYISYNNNFHAF